LPGHKLRINYPISDSEVSVHGPLAVLGGGTMRWRKAVHVMEDKKQREKEKRGQG
jgi:hypothetical protein